MADLHVSWDEYHRLTEQLALKVYTSGWRFNQIICIARGGLRVGDVLARIFNTPLAVMFTSSYRESNGKTQNQLVISEHITMATDTLGDRILLLDDLVDSGVTLRRVVEELKQRYPHIKEVRTGVIWEKSCSVFKPDYVVDFLEDNPWIHQPMEKYDEMSADELVPLKRI
ncbi:phosphoribosyltransferase [Leeia sp. TBRC 13508]|uniref:Phosphoribosyltransferase n=1 Tax=Leeia speluncae TaxID=2884804 RepID=A0ABS8D768_9NEIS|nr:phosphoribosyltransferase [Leeia speluncae]MCB6183883.1 phosphoribosyltransferase [Leeia speluncae]